MTRMLKENNLSKNQRIVLDIIEKAKGPLKAYSILFNVQKKGIKAPPQIYRALDKLIEIAITPAIKFVKIALALSGFKPSASANS